MNNFAVYPSLRDRAVFISGGGGGIGASLVEHFAMQGARVGFIDIDAAGAETVCAAMADAPHRPVFERCDVTDIPGLQTAMARLAAKTGPFRVVVNNAGSDDRHAFDTVDEAYWDRRMALNLKHYFFVAQAAFPGMRAAGGGSVINFSSTTWVIGEGGYVGYTTAKAGIIGMTRSLARDFGSHGIQVNAILPGWIITPRQETLWFDSGSDAQIQERQAIKRRLLPPDVARMALFLAAEDSSAITGQSMIVDGGWS
jgi:NAD(P)-dependent dehydrogenase (short-subunit alcohol dehydrogenase family)